jgi:hypothetical protein
MTLVCIHQPDFAPYLGFFDRLLDADIFILLDDAQFLRRGWHHRDKIKTQNGPDWLTLSIEKCPRETPINQVRLSASAEWREANLNLLAENYREAACYAEVIPGIASLYASNRQSLLDFNLAFLDLAFGYFDLRPRIVMASSLNVATARNQRLIDLVKAVGGTRYLSGTGALAYLDAALFEQAGIGLTIQNFKHPAYPQLHGAFEGHLSCLDLFLNCGTDAKRILR